MIKVQRTDSPPQLTSELQQQLTKEFIDSGKKVSVWNKPFIKVALLEMSKGKCVFCECLLTEESKYMEVEHFHHKHEYPEEVVQWDNLLPACKRCNGRKSDHDTVLQPIINPTIDDPKNHLEMKDYRFYGSDKKGKETVIALALNDTDKAILPRFKIANTTINLLEELWANIETHFTHNLIDGRKRNKFRNSLKGLLQSCQPTEEYSATCAHALLHNENYLRIKIFFENNKWWDDTLTSLEQDAKSILIKRAK